MTAETAIRTMAKLARPHPRKPRPPVRSAWVGVSSRSSREILKSSQDHTRNTQSQRNRKKYKTGRLTSAYHQPARVVVEFTRSQLGSPALKSRTKRETS